MLNIVIPMAGRGSRFSKAGYTTPKPLIEIHGHPMIEYVIRSVRPSCEHRFIFLCLKEHMEKYDLEQRLQSLAPGCVVIPIDTVTAMGNADGLIMTLFANDTKWSFIRYDENRFVTMVREKEVISNEATVGIYNYRHGRDFVSAAHSMIEQNIRVNGEFYVAPVYNEMIRDGKKITFHNIGDHMYGLGVPEDLEAFVKLPISRSVFDS